jgi:hypothetical protein
MAVHKMGGDGLVQSAPGDLLGPDPDEVVAPAAELLVLVLVLGQRTRSPAANSDSAYAVSPQPGSDPVPCPA